jgi:hypothetical protein
MFGRCHALMLLTAILLPCDADGQNPFAPQTGVLVLRNGQVLEGEVTRAGDYYIVSKGEGSEVRPKADEVELFCASMHEAYEFKARHVSGTSAKQHVELAKWCLRHGMYDRCSEQLTAATRLEPNNLQAKELETRLALAVETPPPQITPAASHSGAAEDLEQTLRGLPKGSVEKFGAIVQPILLNRCAANQCHGPNSKSDFHLLRPPPGQIVSRRFTQRNLQAALRYIDRTNPEASPLVVLPQQRHGNSLSAVFDKHSATQLSELLAWAKMTSGVGPRTAAVPGPATIAPSDITLSQPATSTKPADEVGVRVMRPPLDQASVEQPPKEATPRDRFDPEIFNRRYHPK